MENVETIVEYLDQLAPPVLAESWDNVGLLVGDLQAEVRKVMTCLTVTGSSVAEAVTRGADLVVTHHPLPFHPLKRLTADTPEGRYLLDLIAAKVSVYSAHTAFDSAVQGINQRLAVGLELINIAPLVPQQNDDPTLGSGRMGELPPPSTLGDLAARLKQFLGIEHLRAVGDALRTATRVAIACGSAGEFLEPARQAGCDVLVTGEASFHTCLAAEAHDSGLLLTGHFASERFGMERLAAQLAGQFADLEVWACRNEKDPLWLA